MCVCVCMYIRYVWLVNMSMCTCVSVCRYLSLRAHMCVCAYLNMCVLFLLFHMCLCAYVCLCAYLCVFMPPYMCDRVHVGARVCVLSPSSFFSSTFPPVSTYLSHSSSQSSYRTRTDKPSVFDSIVSGYYSFCLQIFMENLLCSMS